MDYRRLTLVNLEGAMARQSRTKDPFAQDRRRVTKELELDWAALDHTLLIVRPDPLRSLWINQQQMRQLYTFLSAFYRD